MHQRDMERFAFLFLCGKRDRAILLGKEKMTFSDLDRLTYVSDFLGFKLYNLEIWNEYAGQFSEQFRQLELLYDETCSIVSWDPTETVSGKRDGRSHGDRHRVGACLFFAENQERLQREVIGNVSISIHELLAVARESEGVKAVQGDDMLCEKRFAPDTRYMVEFLLLEQKEQFGEKGEYHRYFLTKEAYQELINLQNQGVLRFQRQALVLEGTLHYLPAQAFFRDRE